MDVDGGGREGDCDGENKEGDKEGALESLQISRVWGEHTALQDNRHLEDTSDDKSEDNDEESHTHTKDQFELARRDLGLRIFDLERYESLGLRVIFRMVRGRVFPEHGGRGEEALLEGFCLYK